MLSHERLSQLNGSYARYVQKIIYSGTYSSVSEYNYEILTWTKKKKLSKLLALCLTAVSVCLHSHQRLVVSTVCCRGRPHGLTFTWWDDAVYVFDKNQPSLPTHFHSALVSVFVFMALSTVFHSINSHDSSLSHSALPISFLPYWSFQQYISLWKSPSALI